MISTDLSYRIYGRNAMTRIIYYEIKESEDGLRVEQYLKRKGYSSQNIASIKRMPESILVNGVHYYMRKTKTLL